MHGSSVVFQINARASLPGISEFRPFPNFGPPSPRVDLVQQADITRAAARRVVGMELGTKLSGTGSTQSSDGWFQRSQVKKFFSLSAHAGLLKMMHSAVLHVVLFLVLVSAESNNELYTDSPELSGQGFRKQFLSIRHHMCSHRFFQTESRARASTVNVFPYIRNGIEMELGVLAATTSIDNKVVDGVAVSSFEALIFASKRNFSSSRLSFFSHCVSESCQFTDLKCVVNGVASRATVYQSTRDFLPPLQSVLKCDIKADASTDLVVTLSSPSDSLLVDLHLCALNRSSVSKVVGCAQPWMDAHSLERRYPGVHRAYILSVLAQSDHYCHSHALPL